VAHALFGRLLLVVAVAVGDAGHLVRDQAGSVEREGFGSAIRLDREGCGVEHVRVLGGVETHELKGRVQVAMVESFGNAL
jgi:hypothetical protein